MVWQSSNVKKRLFTLGLGMAFFLVSFTSIMAAQKGNSPADRCRAHMTWLNPNTQALLRDFDRNDPNAKFGFLFQRLNGTVQNLFNNQFVLQGAEFPPMPTSQKVLEAFDIHPENILERKRIQLAFEALLVLLAKPGSEELMLEMPMLFSKDSEISKIEREAFKALAHFVKLRLRGVRPENPKLTAYYFFSGDAYAEVGFPMTFWKGFGEGLRNAPLNSYSFLQRNFVNPGDGLKGLGYDLMTQWMILRRNPFKPFAQRAVFAQEADTLLNLRRTLREAHDEDPLYLTRNLRPYHFQAIQKINNIISQPSGKNLPLLGTLKQIQEENKAKKDSASLASNDDVWTQHTNAVGTAWTADILIDFTYHVEGLMGKAGDKRKIEALPKKDLLVYLLQFMSRERITALVRGIEAAHREQNGFLDSKRDEIQSVLLSLQNHFDRYRIIPSLIAKNEAASARWSAQAGSDLSEFSRLAEEKRSLKLEKIGAAQILAGLFIKATVITEHFHLQMDPVFDDLYRNDNLFRLAVKRLVYRAQFEIDSRSGSERQTARDKFMTQNHGLMLDYLSGKEGPEQQLIRQARGLHSAGAFSRIPVLRDAMPFIYMFGLPLLTAWGAYQSVLRQDDLASSRPIVISSSIDYVKTEDKFMDGKYELLVKWSVSPPTKIEIQALLLIWDQLLESDVPPEFKEKWAELAAEKAPFFYSDGKLFSLITSAEKWREAFNKPGSDLRDLIDWTIRFNYFKNRKLRGDSMIFRPTSSSGTTPPLVQAAR